MYSVSEPQDMTFAIKKKINRDCKCVQTENTSVRHWKASMLNWLSSVMQLVL